MDRKRFNERVARETKLVYHSPSVTSVSMSSSCRLIE